MRSILRTTALVAALVTASMGLAAAPSWAAPAGTGASARPSTLPTAHITGAKIWFRTNDEDKDVDTQVLAYIRSGGGKNAGSLADSLGHFDDGQANGPYDLSVSTSVTAADLSTGVVGVAIVPDSRDTWRFDYELAMTFSDGTSFVIERDGVELSEFNRFIETPFTLVAQVPVPNVVGQRQAAATAALQAAGLTVGRVTHQVDPLCSTIGKVSTETPGAGTTVPVGTAVNLTIGDAPKKDPCP